MHFNIIACIDFFTDLKSQDEHLWLAERFDRFHTQRYDLDTVASNFTHNGMIQLAVCD